MAGRFVVWRMSKEDKDAILSAIPGTVWSANLAHAPVGWTAISRAALQQVRDGRGGLANRNGLPPHRYIELQPGAPTPQQVSFLEDWVRKVELQRPSDPGFGTPALGVAARAAWSLNNKLEALTAEMAAGQVSIEVYYLGRHEMI